MTRSAIINIDIKVPDMSLTSCPCCVVVLTQQQERNISQQNQCQDPPLKHSYKDVKKSTVVENGRVVVKPLEIKPKESSE